MKRPAPYVCDVCCIEKKETNHWFILLESYDIAIDVGQEEIATRMFKSFYVVFGWDTKLADLIKAKHICGENCLAKIQSDSISMSKRSLKEFGK